MTIDEIYKKEEISVRSYHVCKYNELNSISDLKKYYYKNKSFEKLRNCGRKSNEELIELCNKYRDEFLANRELEIKKENSLKNIISNLTRIQREVINSFILVNTNSLSVRSKNAISLHLKRNFRIKNFAEKIFFNSVDIKHWKNIGAKSIPEIELYISTIRDFVKEVSESNEERKLISLKNNFLIQRTFSISKIPKEVLETESIFLLVDFLLNQNALFDKTQTTIIKNALKLYQNQEELSLDEIAEKVNLTRERVRQIRKLCIDNLFNKLLFIQNFDDDLHQKYGLDIENHHLEIDDNIIFKINNSNKTNFSKEFISYTVYIYLFNKYNLIGDIEDILQPTYFNSRKKHNWKNFYLINSKIANEVNFISMADDVDKRLNDRIEETYFFNFKSYLFKFLSNNNYSILNISLPVAEKIINDEFNLFLDLNDNIIFQRNTHKQVPEYIIEALEHLGEPSKLNEIYNWINRNYPEATKSEEALRGSCQRSNEIIYFGRSSTFGLKKWEKTRNDIKGGTIKDIITELLENSKTPLHITEILTEIHKYREKTNERNIITNLKLDPNNSFIIFNQKFIGLASQKNSYDLEKYRNLPIQLGKT
ncbi:sigma factor-like helix-turn-helix DNA-binding protein, partial [Jejuia pallidilutea]